MKILIVGGTGTIGHAVHAELVKRHTVITAGLNQGDYQVDITQPESIQKLYKSIGKIDAVVITTGKVHFGTLAKMTNDDYQVGLQNKLMGQVNTVLLGLNSLNDGGSFTLTSGILSHDPIRSGSSASMVNGAIDSFVKASAIEMPRQLRINGVSPTVLAESMDKFGEYFRGFKPVSASDVALAYSKSVEGAQTGQIYRVLYP